MALFAIGDLHLSLGGDKPMDGFPGWQDYVRRLEENWRDAVAADDTVVLAGDISWAMRLEDCKTDFAFIHSLPGQKVLMKGNHDYWWTTRAKMDAFLAENGFVSLTFLHNNCVAAQGVALCGTRGWLYEAGEPHDAKVMAREAGRLRASLQEGKRTAPEAERIVFLHYPPLYPGAFLGELPDMMRQEGVRRCYYGHLHGAAVRRAVQGVRNGIHYRLVSADALGFAPLAIET